MKSSIVSYLTLSLACCTALFVAVPAVAKESSSEQSFPNQVSFTSAGKKYQLQITGTAVRKKFFVKVYNVAHYMQDAASVGNGDPFQAILQDNKAKQLTLIWDRDVSGQKVMEGYRESFQKALSEGQRSQLKSQVDTYIGFFQNDVQKGDEHVLRWIPGQVEVSINGTVVGTIPGQEFAKGLWSIWFGNNSVVDRNALVSQLK